MYLMRHNEAVTVLKICLVRTEGACLAWGRHIFFNSTYVTGLELLFSAQP